VATQIRVTGDDGSRLITLGKQPIGVRDLIDDVPVRFAPLHGRTLTVTVTKVEPLVVRAGAGYVLEPVGITELGIPGVRRAPVPAQLPDRCLDGLFAVDGRPVSVRVTGTTADALAGRPLAISACGASQTLTLSAGRHQLVARLNPHNPANSTALDVQRLALGSSAGGAAAPAASLMSAPAGASGPAVTVRDQSRTAMTVQVAASDHSSWLVLGQSINDGWHATINGRDLGAPRLVDGYANGWPIPASAAGLTIHLSWTPQRYVWFALWLSLVGGLACVGIVVASSIRRRRALAADGVDPFGPVVPAAISARAALLEAPVARGSTRATLVPVLTLAIISGLIVVPWVGVLVGALTFWATRDRRVRFVIRYAPAAVVGAIAIYMAIAQAVQHYPTGGNWPALFAWERIPVWIALFLLLADAVVGRTGRTDGDTP